MTKTRIGLGFGLFLLILGAAIFAPLLSPFVLHTSLLEEQLRSPSWKHWLGQNHQGEDLLTIILHGGRVSLLVGLVVVPCSLIIGTGVGLLSGFYGGKLDRIFSYIIDTILAFPGILLAIAVTAVLGPSLSNVILALLIGGWIPFARLVRGQVLSLKERPFVVAARAVGASGPRLMFHHLLPNLWSSLVVQGTYAVAAAILAESSLSFLGLGVAPGTPSWGAAVSDGCRYLLVAPHLATFPGIAIMLTVLSLNLIGDGLRDTIDR